MSKIICKTGAGEALACVMIQILALKTDVIITGIQRESV